MADNAQDRNLPASERKIRRARDEGQLARSRDLGHLAVLGFGLALLIVTAPLIAQWLQRLVHGALRFDSRALAEPGAMTEQLVVLGGKMLALVLPFGAAVALAAALAAVLAGGWNFSWQPLVPRWSKLAPLQGLQRLVSLQHFGEMGKACLLALALVAVGGLLLQGRIAEFAGLVLLPLPAALGKSFSLLGGALVGLLVLLAAFAAVDVPLQRVLLLRRLRMSHEEAKKENKDVEGNIAIKAKIRLRMREMANRRMFAAVPKADLVVMNPTHYAVALKYDEAAMSAPRVVAKGTDLVALRIRDLAREHGVPVLQAPPLARALWAHSELDREIPAALFSAVAQVLAWVFQLRQAGAQRTALLAAAPSPEVPPALDPHQSRGAES